MKGIVLGYDTETEAIVLRAEDGARYRFAPSEWRDRQSARKGDEVDFEPDGDRAREVYAIAAKQPVDAAAVSPLSVVAGWPPARFFLLRPVLTCAILVLLACLTGAYSVGDIRISVLEAPELISRMSEALDSLIAASGTDPGPRLGAGVARILLLLLLGLYVVPILAALTIWREFVGRPDRKLARFAGIAAIVLPIGLPVLIGLVVQIWVVPGIPDVGARLGRSGVTTPVQVFEVLRLYGTGTILLIFAGTALWASATGRLSVPLGVRQAADPAKEPIQPKTRTRPDLFAPLRKRRPGTKPVGTKPVGAKPIGPESKAPISARPVPSEVAPAEPSGLLPGDSPAAVPFLKLNSGRGTAAASPGVNAPTATRPDPMPHESAREGTSNQPGSAPADREAAAIAGDIQSALDAEARMPSQPNHPSPPPFLKVGGPASAAAPNPEPDSLDVIAPVDPDLPPRGGSVWPEPVEAPLQRPANEAPAVPQENEGNGDPDDQKR